MAASDYIPLAEKLYVAYYGRPADVFGLTNMSASLNEAGAPLTTQGLTDAYATNAKVKAILDAFGNSPESTALYGTGSTASFVNAVFTYVLNRAPLAKGLTFWTNAIDNHTITRAQAALNIMAGAEADTSAQGLIDAARLAKVITVATNFTIHMDTTPEILGYAGSAAAATARSMLLTVTNTTDTNAFLTTVDNTIATITAGGGAPGATYTLTTGADTVTNKATVNGIISSTAGSVTDTLTATDTLTGTGAGSVLNITHTGTANTDATNGALISNFETMNIRNGSASGAGNMVTVDASKVTGLTKVNANLSSGDVTVTNLATGASIGVIGNGVVANGATTYAYKTATDAQTINISGGVTAGNITASASAGVTKATINSTGAANTVGTIQLDSAGAQTVTSLTINAATDLTAVLTAADFATTSAVTIAGAAPTTVAATRAIATGVDLGVNTTNFKTVDASGLTAGGVKMTLGTGLTSFKGGAGQDIVTTAPLTATVAGEVDGGGGSNDRLVVATATDVNTATKGAEFVNFEQLENKTNTDLDASLIAGITSVRMTGGAGFTNMTATQAANVVVPVTNDTFTLSLANSSGTNDVLGVTLQADTSAGDNTKINFTTATVTGFETLNLHANSGIKTAIAAFSGGVADKVSFAAAANLKSIVIDGNSDVEVDLANATAVTNLDVSGLTGGTIGADIKLAANTGALTVTGSAGTDYIQMNAVGTNGSTTINAGAGNDQVEGNITDIAAQTVNGGDGTDTLTVLDASLGTVNDNSFAHVTGFEKLTLSDTATFNLTSGGFFNSAFATGVTLTAASVGNVASTINLSTYNQAATITETTSAATAATAVTGGSGADTITVTASSYTGAAAGLRISGGAGNDTITFTDVATAVDNAIVITGGTGADTITHVSTGARSLNNSVTYDESGAGVSTTTAYDKITGFNAADGTNYSDKLDLYGSATVTSNVATATAAIGYSNVTYTVANGIITFAGTGAASLAVSDKIAIAAQATATDATTAAFVDGGNTYVYNHSAAGGDSVVDLIGVSAAGLSATNNTVTSNYVYIA
jgi:hypothetical protein